MRVDHANNHSGVCQFELEIETAAGEDREYKYAIHAHQEAGEVEIRSSDGHTSKREDEEALQGCKSLIERIGSSRRMSPDEIIAHVCRALNRSREQIKKLKVKIEYADGIEVGVRVK